ncbi:MAG TPA: hypothetical protein PLA88_08355, partial [Bacteroidales bacterium]|nr:hypothetical protein [Bacteroidales bacterium]
NLTITNNEIINTTYAGIQIADVNVGFIDGNSVLNVPQQGIQIAYNAGYTTSDITVSNNSVTNANTSSTSDKGAIRLYGGSSITGYVNIINNFLTNSFNGVAVKNGEAISAGVHVKNNSITGNSNKAIYHGGTGTLDGTCNWYGTDDYATVISKISGSVTFMPYLVVSTEEPGEESTAGFQPLTPNPCALSAVEITSATSTTQVCGNPGTITVEFSGGTAPFNVGWTGPVSGSATGVTSPYTIAGLTGGTYTVTVYAAGSMASTNVSVGYLPVKNTTGPVYFATIQAAVTAAAANDVIEICDGIYNERVVIDKPITLDGQSEAGTILNGTGLSGFGSGITINSGITHVTIKDLTIKNYAGNNPNTYAGIYAVASNNYLNVQNVTLKDNKGGSGFYANGPIDYLTLFNLDASGHDNSKGAARGIVVWNGLKSHISITYCDVYNNNCCGIELQDGTASGVTMSNNNVPRIFIRSLIRKGLPLFLKMSVKFIFSDLVFVF